MITLGTLSKLVVGERIWENEDELQANVIAFDTKDNTPFITLMFLISLRDPVDNSPRILRNECVYKPPTLFSVLQANTLLNDAGNISLHVSTDRENSLLHLWEGRSPFLIADN